MSYTHLTLNERKIIEEMWKDKRKIREIARELDRSPSTISRELKRNIRINKRHRIYGPYAAQRKYEERIKQRRKGRYEEKELVDYVREKLMLTWSPEQISGRIQLEYPEDSHMRIAFSTIYRWLNLGLVPCAAELKTKLRHHGHTHGDKRGKKVNARELKTRCKEAMRRTRLGDWEADTVVWGAAPHDTYLLNITDRKSRYCCLAVLRSVAKKNMLRAFTFFFDGGKLPLETMTSDRGAEFNCHQEFEEQLGGLFYYTRPSSPWQKPTVENTNGLIRQFFPRSYNVNELSQDKVVEVMNILNNRPRKCLGWKTPAEVLHFS